MAAFNTGDRVDVSDEYIQRMTGYTKTAWYRTFPSGWVVIDSVGGADGTQVEYQCVPVEPMASNEDQRARVARVRYLDGFMLERWTDKANAPQPERMGA